MINYRFKRAYQICKSRNQKLYGDCYSTDGDFTVRGRREGILQICVIISLKVIVNILINVYFLHTQSIPDFNRLMIKLYDWIYVPWTRFTRK